MSRIWADGVDRDDALSDSRRQSPDIGPGRWSDSVATVSHPICDERSNQRVNGHGYCGAICPQDRPTGGSTRNDAAASRQTTDAGGDARGSQPRTRSWRRWRIGSRAEFLASTRTETVTYVVEGRIGHHDNQGHEGTILPGDAQWMTAGRGLIHNEIPAEGVTVHSLRLRVNLPAAAPRYHDLAAVEIASMTLHQNGRLASKRGRSPYGSCWIAVPSGPEAGQRRPWSTLFADRRGQGLLWSNGTAWLSLLFSACPPTFDPISVG